MSTTASSSLLDDCIISIKANSPPDSSSAIPVLAFLYSDRPSPDEVNPTAVQAGAGLLVTAEMGASADSMRSRLIPDLSNEE